MTPRGDDDLALKILHTADWHLGLRFPAFDEADQLKLTRARLEVVERILDLAASYAVDAVLCAGDLFDDPQPAPEWWQGLAAALAKRPDRPIFLLPGNHDPLTPQSVYAADHPFRRALPPYVRVVDRTDFECELTSEAVLYASPCTSQAGDNDLALSLPARQTGDQRIRIGMVHGQTFDIKGYQTNFPVAPDAALQRGFDYLAIGDTHGFREVPPGADAPTVYPSAPEPTKFSERDAGHVALVFFRRHGRKPLIQQERVARWTWREENCTDLESLRRLADADTLATTVLRLVLDMTVSLQQYDEVETIVTALKGTAALPGRVGVLEVERANLKLSAADADSFPVDLPPVLKRTIDRLKQHDDKDKTTRALYHLFKLSRQER